jgi:hypothetical protein
VEVYSKRLEPPYRPCASSGESLENFDLDCQGEEELVSRLSLEEKLAMRVSDFTFIDSKP